MNCIYCKGTLKQSTTSHFVDLKNCMVIIKNVPCYECEQCGEVFFSDEVTQHLDNIVKAVGNLMTEIAVVEYSENVA